MKSTNHSLLSKHLQRWHSSPDIVADDGHFGNGKASIFGNSEGTRDANSESQSISGNIEVWLSIFACTLQQRSDLAIQTSVEGVSDENLLRNFYNCCYGVCRWL